MIGANLRVANAGTRSRDEAQAAQTDKDQTVDPKYATYLVETTDGKIQSGLLAERTEREIVLKLAAPDVAAIAPQRTSPMPEAFLRDLTAEQAADLLEFLAALQ